MTNEEIRKIYELKNQGYGYKKIANELNLAVSTIKSYLLRHKDEPAMKGISKKVKVSYLLFL